LPRAGGTVIFTPVLIGILSDTHGHVEPARAGIAALRAAGADYLIHCGDIGGEEIIDLLAAAGAPAIFVCGNCDYDPAALARYAQAVGVRGEPIWADLELGGKRIAVMHGDRTNLMQQIVSEGKHDYLMHGHTHVKHNEREGSLRIINPGALHRTRQPTVALLDTERGTVKFIAISSAA
jgi:putative phosphoesterase